MLRTQATTCGHSAAYQSDLVIYTNVRTYKRFLQWMRASSIKHLEMSNPAPRSIKKAVGTGSTCTSCQPVVMTRRTTVHVRAR